MKKKTKLVRVAGAPKRTHPTGPIKERVQITVRIDGQLMAEVYAKIKEDNARITDIVERGLQLALGEAKHHTPPWTRQVRFVLANATSEQTEELRGHAVAMMLPRVTKDLSPELLLGLEYCRQFMLGLNSHPYALEALESYSRYEKSAREIAKMA